MNFVIETERLLLRGFVEEDIKTLHEICCEPHILKWMPDWNRSIEERMGWLKWVQGEYSRVTIDSARVMLAVTLKDRGDLIGMVGIGNKEELDDEIEIAYFISSQYGGMGYTTEAAMALSDWCLNSLGIKRLVAIVEPDNVSSQRVLEKCSFRRVGTRNIVNSGDTEERPFYYYSLSKSQRKSS